MLTGQKGASNELRAAAWLIEQGYDVFRNVSPVGPVDLVALRNGEVLLVDVKSTTGLALSDSQKTIGVHQLCVADGVVSFHSPRLDTANPVIRRPSTGRRLHGEIVSVDVAARITGVDEQVIDQAVLDGELERHTRAIDGVPWQVFEADAVKRWAATRSGALA